MKTQIFLKKMYDLKGQNPFFLYTYLIWLNSILINNTKIIIQKYEITAFFLSVQQNPLYTNKLLMRGTQPLLYCISIIIQLWLFFLEFLGNYKKYLFYLQICMALRRNNLLVWFTKYVKFQIFGTTFANKFCTHSD